MVEVATMNEGPGLFGLLLLPHTEEMGPLVDHMIDVLSGSDAFRHGMVSSLNVERIDPEARFPPLTIWQMITKSDVIIADVTGPDPAVMYRIGLAHGHRKRVIFIIREGSGRIPAEFEGNLFFTYDPDDLDPLREFVEFMIEGILLDKGWRREVG